MQVPSLEENQQTLQYLKQERLLNFDVFRHHMSSYFIKPYIDGFYTSRAFQRYQEHPNKVRMTKLWPYEVGAKTGDCRNVATSGTDVATL